MQFTSYQKRAGAWALIATIAALTMGLLAPAMTPFVVAAVLAYALNLVVNWLDTVGRGRLPRLLTVILVELTFIFAVLSVVIGIFTGLVAFVPYVGFGLGLVFATWRGGVAVTAAGSARFAKA